MVFNSYFDTNESIYKTQKYMGSEECVIDSVKLCGTFAMDSRKTVCLTFRIQVSKNFKIVLFCKFCINNFPCTLIREIHRSAINLHPGLGKRVFSHKNGQPKIFRSAKVVLYPTSFSILTVFHLV